MIGVLVLVLNQQTYLRISKYNENIGGFGVWTVNFSHMVHCGTFFKQQGQIHGNPVADGWAGAVMQKSLAIQKCCRPTYRWTDRRTDRHGKVKSHVSATKNSGYIDNDLINDSIALIIKWLRVCLLDKWQRKMFDAAKSTKTWFNSPRV